VFDGDAFRPSLKHVRADFSSGVVVALVALPLCLGIALASGAPLSAGLVSGIIAGLVVSWLGGSRLAVSGPAAGLTVIVLAGIEDLGGFAPFLAAVVISGVLQLALGYAKAGNLARFFPSSVVKGMLAAIGIILILKQIPHAVGYDVDYEGDFAFWQPDGENTLSEIPTALARIHVGAALITMIGLAIMLLWPRIKRVRKIPAPLVVVVVGSLLNAALIALVPGLGLETGGLVDLPGSGPSDLGGSLMQPEWSAFLRSEVWVVGATLAAVASLETLLCIEALDGLDNERQRSDTNRELLAQGVGNTIVGFLGGLPMTAVIVRGSANVQSGAKTRMSSFFHGVILLAAIAFIPFVLEHIPLAALAAILLHIGYKLAPVSIMKSMAKSGRAEWVPFFTTIVAILVTDLLIGVGIGLATALFFVLRSLTEHPEVVDGDESVRIVLGENVSFLATARLRDVFEAVPDGAVVVIDGTTARYIDRDALALLHSLEHDPRARERGVQTQLVGLPDKAA
jgi:SulP family sulfate permease